MTRKTNNFLLLSFVGLFIAITAFTTFPIVSAQTARKVSPTPTPVRTPYKTYTPEPRKTTVTAVTPTPWFTPTPVGIPSVATPIPSPTVDVTNPDEVFKVDIDVVNLNVRVVDRNNHSIRDLRKEDFKVYENNALQEIDTFTKAEVPTNYALVIDNSRSLSTQLEKVIEAGKILVDTNRPNDETAVIRFVSSDKITIDQNFTSKKDEINEALDQLFTEGGQTAIIDAVYLAAETVDEYEKSRNPNDHKRRALILVSDGEDRNSYYKEQQLFEMLRESDVQIYAIGFVNDLAKEGGLIGKSPQEKAKALLTRLATETGGKAYFPDSIAELNGIAKDISNEMRTQFVLSYYPTDNTKDGSFKNIKVTVADGPNKEKRIAITKAGRKSGGTVDSAAPVMQNQTKKP